MPARIVIKVPKDPANGVTVEVDGVTGPSCGKLTEKIEAALGKVAAWEEKAEFHQAAQGQSEHQIQ